MLNFPENSGELERERKEIMILEIGKNLAEQIHNGIIALSVVTVFWVTTHHVFRK